jgi:hypothetical protein
MVLCIVLGLLGLAPVIVDRGLRPIRQLVPHSMVGLATLVIALCQPVIAYSRPGKVRRPVAGARPAQDHPWRPVFYAVHSALGYSAIGLALAAVYLTQTLNAADQVCGNEVKDNIADHEPQKVLPVWGLYAAYAMGGWILANHLFQTGYRLLKKVTHPLSSLSQGEAQTTLEDDRIVKTGVLVFTVGLVTFTVVIIVSLLITEISD